MNRKITWMAASVFIFSTFLIEPAFAVGSMRCGTHIISVGSRNATTKIEVLKKCGEPTERIGFTWIYEKSGSARRTVVFNTMGEVVRID